MINDFFDISNTLVMFNTQQVDYINTIKMFVLVKLSYVDKHFLPSMAKVGSIGRKWKAEVRFAGLDRTCLVELTLQADIV